MERRTQKERKKKYSGVGSFGHLKRGQGGLKERGMLVEGEIVGGKKINITFLIPGFRNQKSRHIHQKGKAPGKLRGG